MKNKAKRDKLTIDALLTDLERATSSYFEHRDIAGKLIQLALTNGASTTDVFEIIKDSYFLRKQI